MAELSFDEDDFDEDDDGDDDDDDDEAEEGEEDDDEDGDESNRSETSYDNERGNVQNEDEEVSTATEDEEAGEDAAASAALHRNRMLDLEGWFQVELELFRCRHFPYIPRDVKCGSFLSPKLSTFFIESRQLPCVEFLG